MDRFVTISGCSGGGKSTLLGELSRRGYAVVEEPGRRIVREELAGDGSALPWVDGVAFARRAIAMALEDLEKAAALAGLVFFDRGLVDAAAALEHLTGEPAIDTIARPHPTNHRVFMAPPWPEIFASDPERRHGFDEAVAEYERLEKAYSELGYELVELPRVSVNERAEFVLKILNVL
ncbi:MAG: AAA family ATPase [Rhizobiaceae bacterium]